MIHFPCEILAIRDFLRRRISNRSAAAPENWTTALWSEWPSPNIIMMQKIRYKKGEMKNVWENIPDIDCRLVRVASLLPEN